MSKQQVSQGFSEATKRFLLCKPRKSTKFNLLKKSRLTLNFLKELLFKNQDILNHLFLSQLSSFW